MLTVELQLACVAGVWKGRGKGFGREGLGLGLQRIDDKTKRTKEKTN